MKIKITILLSVFFFLIVARISIYCAFQIEGWSVQASGMGDAFLGKSDDATGILYNPAGLGLIKNNSIELMHSQLYTGLDNIDIKILYLGGNFKINNFGNVGLVLTNFNGNNDYIESIIGISYSEIIFSLFRLFSKEKILFLDKNYFGITLKHLKVSYKQDELLVQDPVFNNQNNKSVISLDFGICGKVYSKNSFDINYGLAISNLNKPDIGLQTSNIIPVEYKYGFYIKYYTNFAEFNSLDYISSLIDFIYRDNNMIGNLIFKVGSELSFFKQIFFLRVGYNQSNVSIGLGLKPRIDFSKNFKIDYAFLLPKELKQTTGTHKLSIGFEF